MRDRYIIISPKSFMKRFAPHVSDKRRGQCSNIFKCVPAEVVKEHEMYEFMVSQRTSTDISTKHSTPIADVGKDKKYVQYKLCPASVVGMNWKADHTTARREPLSSAA